MSEGAWRERQSRAPPARPGPGRGEGAEPAEPPAPPSSIPPSSLPGNAAPAAALPASLRGRERLLLRAGLKAPSRFADGGERPSAAGPGERPAGAAGPRRGGPEGEREGRRGVRSGSVPANLVRAPGQCGEERKREGGRRERWAPRIPSPASAGPPAGGLEGSRALDRAPVTPAGSV